jgi:flavocytochrome c
MKMKNAAMVALLCVYMAACQSQINTGKAGVSGTFAGKGSGKGGDINVNVTLKDGALEIIEVTDHHESGIISDAMNMLAEEMIARNTIDVDSVTGATLTSSGFKQAVRSALKEAGVEKLDANEQAAHTAEKVEETYDVVVVGAGGAGLVAAITAAETGAKVAVVEKLRVAAGNTLLSGAEYAAPANWLQKEKNIEDSPEALEADMLKGGDNEADPALVKVLAEQATAGAEWLRDDVKVEWTDELMHFGGHTVTRSLVPLGASGVEPMSKLLAKAKELGVTIIYDTTAKKLLVDDKGVVVGVEGENSRGNGDTYTLHANKGVVLATGGFGSNIEMRKKYNPEMDEKYNSTDSVADTGDGIVMAEEIGAELRDMSYIQTYPLCDVVSGGLLYVDDARLYGFSILVNAEGKRFVNELGRRDVLSKAILSQTGGVCYEVMDQSAFEEAKIMENHGGEVAYLTANKGLVKADTLEEAAKLMGVDPTQLVETVKQYNSYVDAQHDAEFERKAMNKKIENGPFYLIKATPAVHHTMGGVAINTEAQVLRPDGTVIPNLYAAGEVTGDIHGTNRLGSCALADLTVFGRIAGQNVVK